ncbi:MAG: hypothetical protein V2B18_12190 [Pseudomonadota bacterium]
MERKIEEIDREFNSIVGHVTRTAPGGEIHVVETTQTLTASVQANRGIGGRPHDMTTDGNAPHPSGSCFLPRGLDPTVGRSNKPATQGGLRRRRPSCAHGKPGVSEWLPIERYCG